MKIVLLTGNPQGAGGARTCLFHLTGALKRKAHEVVLFDLRAASPDGDYPPADRYHAMGLAGAMHDPKAIEETLRVLSAEKPDVVHVFGDIHRDLEANVLERFPSTKSFYAYEFCPTGNKFHHRNQGVCSHPTGALCVARMGYKRCTRSRDPRVILRFYREVTAGNRTNRRYRRIIVPSQYVKENAVQSGYPGDRIRVLPLFTRPARRITDPDTDLKTVLFAGRIVPEKGLDHLLRAMARVGGNSRLVVAGDGPAAQAMMILASRLGLSDRVDFLSWIAESELERRYQEASVVAVPSLWPEPFGNVGLEAMSHARPVVAYRSGGIPEWLQDGRTGFLVGHGDIRMLAEKIRSLLENDKLARELGRSGRRRVEQEFTETRHYETLMRIYGEVTRTK